MSLQESGSTFKLSKIDATENKKYAEMHGVKGFPTIKYFKNGKASDYNGGRKEADIVNYAIKKASPPTVSITSIDQLKSFQESHKVYVIASVDALDSDAAKLITEVAKGNDDMVYGVTAEASVKAELGVTAETLIIFRNFDEPRFDLPITAASTETSITEFIYGHSKPYVQTFTQETAPKIFDSPIKVHALMFTDTSADHHGPAFEHLTTVAKVFAGKMIFVNVPITESRVAEFFGVSAENLPALSIADMGNESGIKKFAYSGAYVSSEISSFVNSFFAGNLKPTLKTEEVSPEDTTGPVVVVKGKSFNDIVIDNDKNVFVEFYAPCMFFFFFDVNFIFLFVVLGCSHCKKLQPIWDDLAETFESDESVVIAKMDYTSNEVDYDGVSVKGFPTLYFFKADDKSHPIRYEGEREFESLESFVRANSGSGSGSGSDEL